MDKRLKLFAISLTSLISATTLGVVAFNYSNNIAFATRAVDAKTTTITLDSSEKPEIDNDGNGALTYSENSFASFSYTGASALENGHVSLADGGTIYKNEASNSLKTFTANFTGGSLKLQTGYSFNDVCYEYTLETGIDTSVKGNYFILESEGATNISNISICFECENEEAEDDHNYESGWTTNETHHWHESLEDNCVRKGNYAEHAVVDIATIAPTKETTGSYNGKECSVCEETLVEPTVLPILSETDYDISLRTAMIDGEVRDSEKYTLKTDSSIYFDIGYGNTVYTEYIHAGTSYYSLPRWNEMFPEAEATAVDGVLTINLTGDTTVTAEDGGLLDGNLNLMLYDSVVIKGNGSLTVAYAKAIDGIEAWNLEIQEGATVNLTGFDETRKTGFKVYGTLQIDGIANVTNYGYAVGFNTDNGSSSKTFALNIGSTGELNISNARDGIHVWGTPTGGCRLNISGKLDIDASEDAMQFETQVFAYFKDDAKVTLDAGAAGIYNHDEDGGKTPDNRFWFQGNAEVTITATEGCGIKLGNTGRICVQDSSKLTITAGSSGINGYERLYVCNGDHTNPVMSSSSLIVKTYGNNTGTHSMASNVNPIGARGTDWCATALNTSGKVLIEELGDGGRTTGIHLGGKNGSDLHFKVLCTNMTIKNCYYAIGCWVNTSKSNNTNKVKLTYTNSGSYDKIHIIGCTYICNSDSPEKLRVAFKDGTDGTDATVYINE